MLSAEIALVPEENRGSLRRIVNLAAAVRSLDALARRASIIDLSEAGCRLIMNPPPAVGSELIVKITGHVPIWATVAWSNDGEAGLEFHNRLPTGTIECLSSTRHLRGKRLFSPPRQSSGHAACTAAAEGRRAAR